MSILPDIFVDPKLRARQNQLDAQWKALRSSFQTCDATPDSSFAEFTTDFDNWSAFYATESDWSAGSKSATDEWQTKAQDWSNRLRSWGCTGSFDGFNVVSALGDTSSGIPTVKDPPPDDPGLLDSVLSGVHKVTDPVTSTAATIGWVAVGLLILIIGSIVWIVTRGAYSGYGVKVGKAA
jgi:hypothetical protein